MRIYKGEGFCIMKKMLCMLVILGVLLVGSAVALADPEPMPGFTSSIITIPVNIHK